jgi:hypothetical protein
LSKHKYLCYPTQPWALTQLGKEAQRTNNQGTTGDPIKGMRN